MLKFLKESRKFANNNVRKTCIVIGNESCDLDSAVCSITLAYFLQTATNSSKIFKVQAQQFLPVFNIPRIDYPLKTEVRHLLQKHQVNASDLTFQDELSEDFLKSCEFVLVDHHVSPYLSQTVAIYDHRPRDDKATIPTCCHMQLELVGSCATLIAELFLTRLQTMPSDSDSSNLTPLDLLRHVIVLDTVNFSKSAARATPKDEAICVKIEEALAACSNHETQNRQAIFDELLKARADITELTAAQLLRKDRKFITNSRGSLKIALPGFPQAVQSFIEKTDAEESIKTLAAEHNCDVVLLLGMYVQDDGSVQRDVGLIDIKAPELSKAVAKLLLQSTEPVLHLEAYDQCTFMQGMFFRQHNIKATRKHILPRVKNLLEEWAEC